MRGTKSTEGMNVGTIFQLGIGFWIVQNPKSLDFGLWIWTLAFGFWILELRGLNFGFGGLDSGIWTLDFGFWAVRLRRWALNFGVRGLDSGSWIYNLGLGRRASDLGLWHLAFAL